MTIAPHYFLPDENGFRHQLLDDLLAAGYYRMLHTVFTTHHTQLNSEGDALPVFWLRTHIPSVNETKAALAIRKKCSGFSVAFSKAAITNETEQLYSLYHSAIDFNSSPSCYACMHDSTMENPFDSWMIEVRDADTLIAAGYFDLGSNAITGILNFYHPAYKKYSPGKYLMLQKIDWARSNNIEWYYTGYTCIGSAKFDYKIFPDEEAIEVFLPFERKWVPYASLKKEGLEKYWMKYT